MQDRSTANSTKFSCNTVLAPEHGENATLASVFY